MKRGSVGVALILSLFVGVGVAIASYSLSVYADLRRSIETVSCLPFLFSVKYLSVRFITAKRPSYGCCKPF